MDCRCDKCNEKHEEIERLSALKKLSAEEIHVLNKDKRKEINEYITIAFFGGLLAGIALGIVLALSFLGA